MSGICLELVQKALYTELLGDAPLLALVTGVYDRVPERTALPYLVFGASSAREASNITAPAELYQGELVAYSREGGRKQALDILERVHSVLHHHYPTLTGGWRVVWLRVEQVRVEMLTDGKTWRGSATITALVEP